MNIPITKPFFDENEIRAVSELIKTGWLVQGPKVKEFEELFAKHTGARFAIATTSCTAALHLGLIAAGIKKGDPVIVPSFTFVATANAVEYIGAKPVFCDIDLATFNIDTGYFGSLLKKYKGKVKAVIPVHLFGLCADMGDINKLAEKYKCKIIEDAACAAGAYYKDKHAGSFGFAGCFSFHPRKVITVGEGGMIITDDLYASKLLRSLRDHGSSKSDLKRHIGKGCSLLPEYNILGYNYRMTDIQASIGIEQMKKLEYIISERRRIAKVYNENLKDIEWFKIPTEPEGYIHSYQSYVCLIKKECFKNKITKANAFRIRLMNKLEHEGIATRQGTHAIHILNYYKNKYILRDRQYLNSFIADRLSITLPLFVNMTDTEQKFVISQLKNFS